MLVSTAAYFQALSKGDYLRFLEWPVFITKRELIKTKDVKEDADEVLDLLVFAWLNHGFKIEEVKKIASLYAANERHAGMLREHYGYALTAIAGAAIQCMVYQGQGIESHFKSDKEMNQDEFKEFMLAAMGKLPKNKYLEAVFSKQVEFLDMVEAVGNEATDIYKRLLPCLKRRYLIWDYLTALKAAEDRLSTSDCYLLRLSFVKRLVTYLDTVTEINDKVTQEIESYIVKIKQCEPEAYEKQYLTFFDKPSLWSIALNSMGFFADGFFELEPDVDSEKKKKNGRESLLLMYKTN